MPCHFNSHDVNNNRNFLIFMCVSEVPDIKQMSNHSCTMRAVKKSVSSHVFVLCAQKCT